MHIDEICIEGTFLRSTWLQALVTLACEAQGTHRPILHWSLHGHGLFRGTALRCAECNQCEWDRSATRQDWRSYLVISLMILMLSATIEVPSCVHYATYIVWS